MDNKQICDWLPAYPDPNASLFKPNIPLWKPIPNGLLVGKIVEIRGFIPSGCDKFEVNLAKFRDEGSVISDRPLHISVRPNYKVVVRNSFEDGQYGSEERNGKFPFDIDKQFLIFILVEQNGFRIAVDCKHLWEFYHRMKFSKTTMLHINGGVRIDEVRFREPYFSVSSKVPSIQHQISNGGMQPVINPTIPYFHSLPDGIKPGEMIYISGRPTSNARRFSINLVCSRSPYPPPEDIALHFDARIASDNIVRNTCVNEKWGREETIIPFFPFMPGAFFDMIIRIESETFMIAINGQHFLEFRHRLFPLAKVNMLHIEREIIISSIRFAMN